MGSHRLAGSIAWIILGAVLAAFGGLAPAVAHDDDHGCHSHFRRVMQIRYDPATAVAFNLGAGDFEAGYQDVLDHGHLHWWANTSHWRIKLGRTAWSYEGDGDFPDADGVKDIRLRIKTDTSPATSYVTIPLTATTWFTSCRTGTGTFDGVDWKVDRLNDEPPSDYGMLPPGTYSCTVTFTIEHSS